MRGLDGWFSTKKTLGGEMYFLIKTCLLILGDLVLALVFFKVSFVCF